MFRKIYYGIENIVVWFPLIWNDRDWDWAYLTRLMEFKLRKMSKHFDKYGYHVGNDKDAREMLICAELLKRIEEDDCVSVAWWRYETRMKEWEHMFGKMFSKKLRHWWN
jgi:hypothetical protein